MSRKYDDDDGRTIADMSGLSRRPLLFPKPEGIKSKTHEKEAESSEAVICDPGEKVVKRPQHMTEESLDKEGRKAAISGAVAAGLLIAGALIVGLAIVIIIFTSFGR